MLGSKLMTGNPMKSCLFPIFMSPSVIDTGAHLGVGNMSACPDGRLAKFVQAVRKSCVIIGKGQGGDMI